MQKTVYFGCEAVLFLKEFQIDSKLSLLIVLVVMFLLSALQQSISHVLKFHLARSSQNFREGKRLISASSHLIQTSLRMFETTMSLLLSLAVATFNLWIILAVIAGSGAGSLLLQLIPSPSPVAFHRQHDSSLERLINNYYDSEREDNLAIEVNLVENANDEYAH